MDCRKSHFNPNPDAVLCLETLTGKTLTLCWLMDESVCVPCCLVRPNCDRTQSLSKRTLLLSSVSRECCLVRAASATGVTQQQSSMLRSVRKQRGILVFCFHLWCGDSSPTLLLIPVFCHNTWLILSASAAYTCLFYPSLRRTLNCW